ncbi:hypothetical protein BTUL_0033g00640 [Botrytis tulipae]|uniref:Uncharacterized protein n=1 Tax=Botrytis tulipae TaxID=87230 RepID=A0A4Z1EUZ4_9HELO|nr:hypothetical protein BTUL_0033g00640 [Botrytis tulipae]
MIAAIGNKEQGGIIIKELLAKKGASIVITEEIMITAVANTHHGDTIIRDLFAQHEANVVITEEIVISAVRHKNNGGMIIKEFTEDMVRVIVNEMDISKGFLQLLIKNPGGELRVTEGMVRMVKEKLSRQVGLLETTKDNIQRHSSGSTGGTG